jgi:predicted metal-dependent hydrolase
MIVAGIQVELVQKDIKNLHLAVYPPEGRVRLAAPLSVNQKTLELYVISKIGWIRRQQRKFATQTQQSPREYVNRESHYFLGKRYLLRVHETGHKYRTPLVAIKNKSYIDLYVKEGYTIEQKADVMKEWYRTELKKVLAELVPKWEKILGVAVNQYKVQSMRTKWGSCNTEKKTILFNVELAKKSHDCIEYVVAHELIHLYERTHNDNFKAYLNRHLHKWKSIRNNLNLL